MNDYPLKFMTNLSQTIGISDIAELMGTVEAKYIIRT